MFIQRTYEIGSALVGVIVMLVSFTVILWGISATTPMPLFGVDLSFPGYLVLIAFCYAAVGTLIAHVIGRRLIGLNFQFQRREADLRYATARVTDHSEEVALLRAEAVERAEIDRRIGGVIGSWARLVGVQTRLTGFTYGYSHVSLIFPTLVVAPAYLVGAIQLGVLVQAAAAFQKVESSFSYFVNAYARIAEWKAALDRVWQLELALQMSDLIDVAAPALDIDRREHNEVTVRNLVLQRSGGELLAGLPDMRVGAGERILVSGPSASGKSILFRTLSGLWPFGAGQIRTPDASRVLVLPARPYFPLGTLRQALAAPRLADDVTDHEIRDAMTAAGLGHLTGRLDEEAEWHMVLSAGEQQLVGLVRALLFRPAVLLFDDVDAIFGDGQASMLFGVLAKRLPETIIISASRSDALADLHHRVIVLGAAGAAAPSMIAPLETV
jgi:putative ATP-binding cassette transporter